jgi:hypothetical protein
VVNNTSGDTVGSVQFCYSTTEFTSGNCSGVTSAATAGTPSASVTPYSANLTGLASSTTYYYELTATDVTAGNPLYGGVQSFTTGPVATTGSVSLTSDTTATINGSVYNPAGDNVSGVSFCVSPTTFDLATGVCPGTQDPATTGSSSPSGNEYTASLTSLVPGGSYYYQIEATVTSASSQTILGSVNSFVAAPVAATTAPVSVTDVGAVVAGTVYNPSNDSISPAFCVQSTPFTSGTCPPGDNIGMGVSSSTTSGTTTYTEPLSGLPAVPMGVYYVEMVVTDSTTGRTLYGGVQSFVVGPSATTQPAVNVTNTSARLVGTIANPAGDSISPVTFCVQSTSFTSGKCLGSILPAVAGATSGSTTTYSAVDSSTNNTTAYYELSASDSSVMGTLNGGVQVVTPPPTAPVITNASINITGGTLSSSGAPLPGDVASATYTTASPGLPVGTVTYQCYNNGQAITGATGSTYTVASSDVGGIIGVTVTDTNSVGQSSTSQTFTPAVSGIAPTITSAAITGTPVVGQTLTAQSVGVTGTPTPVETYQWLENDTRISGATGLTYVVQPSDAGKVIAVTVTETNSAGQASASSPWSQPVTTATSPTITSAFVTGTPAVGRTLTAHSVGVTGVPTPVESYQWLDDGSSISGATGLTYVVQPSDYNQVVTVTITETNPAGQASTTSIWNQRVVGTIPTITSATITGTPDVGQTLTAHSAGVTGLPTPAKSYQWYDNGQAISGATGSTYAVQSSDAGQSITVTIAETNAAGQASATSTPTSSVLSNQPPVVTTVAVSPGGVGVITWKPSPNTSSNGYAVQYSTDGGTTWTTVLASDISGTTATVGGLHPSGSFKFRVSTTTASGSVSSTSAVYSTKPLPKGVISLPSKPFAAYSPTFGASKHDLSVIITTLREVSALHLKSVTIIGYAIYETKAHDGKGKYLTINQVRNLAKSRAYSAIKFMQGLERKLHIAPVKFVVKPVIEMGKSRLKNFEKFRRMAPHPAG